MVQKLGPEDLDLTIKFGAGLNTRASEDEIDEREAADGQNFTLDLENKELRNRKPFDLIGTVPNASSINGGGCLIKADGTVSFLIQAGTDVYEWDGATTFTSVLSSGVTVNTNAKLRGHWRTQNWQLTTNKLLLTDLALLEEVKEWDGTTFADVTFRSGASALFGTFFAKYLVISNERAIYSHIKDPGTTNKHMMVGSQRSDYEEISVSNRPSSALSEEDPFFLLTPDLRPINGHVEAFGSTILSSDKGQLFNLTGSTAKDFAFTDFYPGSAASGDESVAYIGNDIIYGRQGRIESVRDTDRFGDSETDDITRKISTTVGTYTGWTTVYNSRLNRVYVFPTGQSEVWVFDTAERDESPLSPWMRWKTDHALAFQPTFVMSMLDPSDGLEYVFMGDSSGNLYRLEGTGSGGDGGTTNIKVEWLTKLFSAPLDAEAYNIEGWIKYRKELASTVTLTFEYAGTNIFDESITISLPAATGGSLYGGGFYYADANAYSTIAGRLSRQDFFVPGQGNEFQVRVTVDGTSDVHLHEIGVRLTAAS